MQHPTTRRPKLGRYSAVTLIVALIAGVTVACAPATPGGGSSNQQFCEFFDKVEEKIAEAPPEVPDAAVLDNDAVLVKDQVVAAAEETTVTGQACTDSGAKVELDGAVLAEGEEVPSEQGNAASEPIAAVTGDEIAPDEPVLENVQIKALAASIGPSGITVRGNVAVRLSGQTSTIGFTGTLANLNNWSVTLSSSALTIPGITSSPATFSGTLAVRNGVPTLSLTAAASSAKIGDVTVTGASINLVASATTGVTAAVQGNIKVGPSSASGVVNVAFDKTGKLISAKADISARLVGTQAGGKKIDLTGNVKLEGNATETVASFSGSGIVGDLVVNEANGSLTLATNKATFVGVLDVQQGANYVRFNGSIVWDGITAYTPFLQLEAGGEISGTLNDGQTVSVAGDMETTIVGGQLRTVVTGAFKVGTLKASGSAIVEINGATTTLFVDADLVDAGFSARLEGAVIITDGIAETIQLDAAVNGTLRFGDATLTGAALSVRSSYGSPLDLKFTGGLQIGSRANLSGTVAASFGPNGTLLSMDGQLTGSLTLDSWGLVNFNGRVIASPDQVTLSGSGGITMTNFPLGVTFNGTFTSSLTVPSWSLNGTGKLRIASIEIASARLALSQGVGMRATRAGFYFSLIGIPFYFEADFYLRAGGGCDRVNITGGSFLMRPLLSAVLPGVIGCPVTI
jgi:hypothetical protein